MSDEYIYFTSNWRYNSNKRT